MIRGKVHIIFSSFLLILMSSSLTFSTLHSHHHIEWHQSGDFADTGNCITKDTTICPISGYHLKNDVPNPGDFSVSWHLDGYVYNQSELFLSNSPLLIDLGRSPPVVA